MVRLSEGAPVCNDAAGRHDLDACAFDGPSPVPSTAFAVLMYRRLAGFPLARWEVISALFRRPLPDILDSLRCHR